MNIISKLRHNLETIMLSRGMTIADLEDGCNLRRGYIARMGNNQKGTIPLDTVITLSKFVNESIDDLIFGNFDHLMYDKMVSDKKLEIAKLQRELEQLQMTLYEEATDGK